MSSWRATPAAENTSDIDLPSLLGGVRVEDAVRIEQVLTNILTNAVKYTPPGGQIRVALRADGTGAVLSIEDSGVGISPSLLPFIFDMYVQADQTLDRARGGLGIGLALVRCLVELHGHARRTAARLHGCTAG